MAVNFYLETRIDKNGDAPIRVSISIQGIRIITSIGHNINPNKWDAKKQKVKQGNSNSKGITYNTINARLNEIDSFFIEYQNRIYNKKITLTKDQLKQTWNSYFAKLNNTKLNLSNLDKTLVDYFDMFVLENGQANDWSKATYSKFTTIKSHIVGFKTNVTFDCFNEQGLIEYLIYLRNVKDMRNTTISKYIGFLKWFLGWTTAKGYNTNTDYIAFKPKLKTGEKRVIFLTWDELMVMYNYSIPESKNYLERVRDVFCFCCFTSLRYSDVYNLKNSDIIDGALHITTVKTADALVIELNKYSRSILAKYKDISFDGDKALPVISNQRMNDYLKELGKMCGIDTPITVLYFKGNKRIEEVYPKYELLGTHAGRRTFICNALALGIPVQVVMKWTGHSDYKAMKPYIDIADNIKAQAMSKFDEA